MARPARVLLLLLGVAEARGERQIVHRFDSAIGSFYVDVERGPLRGHSHLEEQAEVLGKVVGKVAASGVAYGLIGKYWVDRLSGREVPLLDALLKGSAKAEQTAEVRRKDEVQSVESYLHHFARLQLDCLQRHWQGSTLLALAVAVAALSSYKTAGSRRPTSSSGRVKSPIPISLPPVKLPQNYSVVYFDISRSTQVKSTTMPPQSGSAVYFDISTSRQGSSSSTDSTEFDCESELDQADYLRPSRKTVDLRVKDRKERRHILRLPGPKERRSILESEPCTYEYDHGGFVRKRTEDFEKRIEIHRSLSEEFV